MNKIDARQAVQEAKKYLFDMRDLVNAKLKDVRLEEMELLDEQKIWAVTLSYDVPNQSSKLNSMLAMQLPNEIAYTRDYKTFHINSETGEVQSMKIRTLR